VFPLADLVAVFRDGNFYKVYSLTRHCSKRHLEQNNKVVIVKQCEKVFALFWYFVQYMKIGPAIPSD
jgi:hypothetical protein